ncbi:VOC family protein [Aquabacterium sp. NJ1]|uniref:VOC family protein n=1 Tax=Aquabacterium sp. NJ1 TaxID=1538295 RepID=UPI0006901629|nr:VOC family protein [Aquabacterium sp. NJ1]
MSQAPINHAVHWFEIPVSNMARSVAFYERLLGVTLRPEVIAGMELAIFPATDPNAVKGCLMAVEKVSPHTDGVLIYLNAGPSLNAVLARLEACGGTLLTPRVVLPGGMGCFAHITDPDGQRIGLHALD